MNLTAAYKKLEQEGYIIINPAEVGVDNDKNEVVVKNIEEENEYLQLESNP